MTAVAAAGSPAQRIRDALWGLACGEAVAVRAAGPAALRAGPVARELAGLARAVAAAEGRMEPGGDTQAAVVPGGADRANPAARLRSGDGDGDRAEAAGAGMPQPDLAVALRAVLAGLINRPDDLEWLIQDVQALAALALPRQGPVPSPPAAALAAAAAVAAAVSAAVEGGDAESVLDRAAEAASVAVDRPGTGPASSGEAAAAVAHALETLRLTLAGRGPSLPPGGIAAVLASRWEPEPRPSRAVPFALVLAAAAGDARRAILEATAVAARAGTAPATAAVAGAVAGALYPGTVPPDWIAALRDDLDLDALVPELLRLR